MKTYILPLIMILISAVLLTGCVTSGQVKPITPIESQLLARAVMTSIINAREIPDEKLMLLMNVLASIKSGLQLLLVGDLSEVSFDTAAVDLTGQYSEALGPYYDVVRDVVSIVLIRVRPYIDQGQTDLASQYIDAIFQGAIQAIDVQVASLQLPSH